MNVNYLIILIIPLISLGQINWIVFDSENSLLPYNQINDLHIDLDNNLLIGSEYGAAKLNANLEWEVYYNEGESSGLSGNIIKYINTDLNNNIWFCGPDGISILDNNGTYSYLNSSNSNLPSNFTKSLFFENSERAWIGTTSGLVLVDNETWTVFDFLGMINITSNHITKIIKHPSNETIFFGTLNGGLITFNNDFTFYNNDNSQLLDNTIKDLYFDENENLIMTTTFAGLGVWSSTNFWTWFNSQTNPSLPFFINSLDELIIDNENNIWITTMENGLVKYSNNTWTFYNSQNSNLPEDKINSIEFDKINNRIWVGTETAGIAYTDLNYINCIQEDYKKNDIKYSYNNSNITIKSSNHITIKLLNSSGVTVKELKLNKGLNYININNLSSGLYFLYNPELSNQLTQIFKM